jgi:hypothetical protein
MRQAVPLNGNAVAATVDTITIPGHVGIRICELEVLRPDIADYLSTRQAEEHAALVTSGQVQTIRRLSTINRAVTAVVNAAQDAGLRPSRRATSCARRSTRPCSRPSALSPCAVRSPPNQDDAASPLDAHRPARDLADAIDLVNAGHIKATPCPGRCGRAITGVEPGPDPGGSPCWLAVCACGARALIV